MSLKWLSLGSVVLLAACASSSSRTAAHDPIGNYDPDKAGDPGGHEFATIYTRMGLAASGPPVSFVGDVAFFATPSPDTTLALVAVSVPNRGLSFKHDPSSYDASYVTGLAISRGGTQIQQVSDSENVRVTTFAETRRNDESIIYRRALKLTPGDYQIAYSVRDVYGLKEGQQQKDIVVPRLQARSISTPDVVYEATSRTQLGAAPTLLPSPRASFVFGVDDSASIYLESYGLSAPVSMTLFGPTDSVVWRGNVALRQHGASFASGIVRIPLAGADIGVLRLVATSEGATDTTSTPMFMGFGPDLPVLSFNEMVGYLRFFASPDLLRGLRDAQPSQRAARWSEFLRRTDPIPSTPQNEALDAYFARISEANDAFQNDAGHGWRSDRGMVYVGVGAPDQIYEEYGYAYMTGDLAQPPGNSMRLMYWVYNDYQTTIIFYDPYDTGSWRLTPRSTPAFQFLLSRKMAR